MSDQVNKTLENTASAFKADGAVGKEFNPDGAIGGAAEKLGGPLASDGMIGEKFAANKPGGVGAATQEYAQNAQKYAQQKK